jgi:two-component system response regulator MprA
MSCRILVVDDDADARELMSQLLSAEGFDAQFAGDGLEALAVMRSGPTLPDVIVLDMMMPRMDGWAFRRAQSADPTFARIPVVVVSAAPREQLCTLKAAAIVPKPCDFNGLVSIIKLVAQGHLAR